MRLTALVMLASMTAGCVAATGRAAADSPNLLLNGGFELGREGDRRLKQWTPPPERPGLVGDRVTGVAHSGRACARLRVGPEVEVTWYSIIQRLPSLKFNQPYTLSAWVKTEDLRDGYGAYLSLGFYSPTGERTGFRDSDGRATGTTDWTHLTTTTEVPPGTSEMQAILVVHGHGTAYYDDVQLEEAAAATPYVPSRADAEAEAKSAARRAEADAYKTAAGFRRELGKNVAILRDKFPKLGAPSDPEVMARALQAGGFRTDFLTADQLANPELLRPDVFDLVVLPYGRAFPAPAREAFQEYLALGGCFFSTGGYAFDSQLIKTPEGWVSPVDRPRKVGPHVQPLVNVATEDFSTWNVGGGPGGPGPKLTVEPAGAPGGEPALKWSVSGLRAWATAVSPPIPKERFFPGWSQLIFRARGDENTKFLIVELHERDGCRWKARVALTPEWKQVVLLPSDFSYWQDNPAKGRGGPGDHPNLHNMERLLLGLSTEVVADGGDYAFWLADLRVADDPLAAAYVEIRPMNTRTCRINDAMWPEPEQIGVFDPSHPLRNAVTAKRAWSLDPNYRPELKGPFEGFAATGVLSVQGHGFGPDNSRIVPVIASFDEHGRPRGALGSMMFHFGGNFRGSAWGFFGVENQDLFSEQNPQMLKLLPQTVQRLIDRVFVFGTEAEYNSYRPGETAKLRTNVANFGPAARKCWLLMIPGPPLGPGAPPDWITSGFQREVTLRPGTVESLAGDWKVPDGKWDGYQLTGQVQVEGNVFHDEEENAFVVWRDDVVAKGPRPVIKDTYFYQKGQPRCLIGCQNWWGTNGSISQRRTLDWDRDFQMMQDMGLHFSRCFLPWENEEQKRASDAWVYLAQKHGIVLFHTPNLNATADPKGLAEELARAKDIARRYKDVPGLIVDTCNETGIIANDSEGQRGPFNEWLKARYGDDAKLRAAWADDPPEKPLPGVPFRWPAQKWESLRARDVSRFAQEALGGWATMLRDGFRSERADLAVTPGWGQGFGWGAQMFDAPLASRDQDFTDAHYYGDLPGGYVQMMKPLDRRWDGKPWTTGECGSKPHPSYPDGETEEQFCRRFLTIVHHAFGMGQAFVSSWHWRDPMAGIFPCGLVFSDYALRDAALVERNQALMFGGLHPSYRPAEVFLLMPDGHRIGGGNNAAAMAVYNAVDTLVGLHVDFGSLCEADLDRLPATCKALVWPCPYCPGDATFEKVARFVEAGGKLLVTGDVSYDEDRRWTRSDRAKRLTGATEVSRRSEALAFGSGKPVTVTCLDPQIGPATYPGRPAVTLRGGDARVLARDEQGTVACLSRLGGGSVMFVAEPVETEATGVPRRGYYAAFLAAAGISRLQVAPDRPALHAFRLATQEGGQVLVVDNSGPATRVTVTAPGATVDLDLAEGLPGLCVLDARGRCLEAEAQGEVRVNGKRVLRATMHAAALTLDGKPLADSAQVVVLPFAAGSVELRRAGGAPLGAECGEVTGGRWRAFGPVAVRPGQGAVTVQCNEVTRLEMILVSPAGKLEQVGSRLAEALCQ